MFAWLGAAAFRLANFVNEGSLGIASTQVRRERVAGQPCTSVGDQPRAGTALAALAIFFFLIVNYIYTAACLGLRTQSKETFLNIFLLFYFPVFCLAIVNLFVALKAKKLRDFLNINKI